MGDKDEREGGGLLGSMRRMFGGGPGGPDELRRRVVEALLVHQGGGARGRASFPPALEVTVTVPADQVARVERMTDDPSFDPSVADRLLNELARASRDDLPVRVYAVVDGDRLAVVAEPTDEGAGVALFVLDGDRAGERLVLPLTEEELRIGRGPNHGPADAVANDLVVTATEKWVSRAAATIRRAGAAAILKVVDQGEDLVGGDGAGGRKRPARTRERSVRVERGDVIELRDPGSGATIRVAVGAPESGARDPDPDA